MSDDLTPLQRLQRPDFGPEPDAAAIAQAEADMVWAADRIEALERALRQATMWLDNDANGDGYLKLHMRDDDLEKLRADILRWKAARHTRTRRRRVQSVAMRSAVRVDICRANVLPVGRAGMGKVSEEAMAVLKKANDRGEIGIAGGRRRKYTTDLNDWPLIDELEAGGMIRFKRWYSTELYKENDVHRNFDADRTIFVLTEAGHAALQEDK